MLGDLILGTCASNASNASNADSGDASGPATHATLDPSTASRAYPPRDGLPDYDTNGYRPDYGFPGDLMWVSPQRLVRIAPHFVSVWSIDGQRIAQFVVPE